MFRRIVSALAIAALAGCATLVVPAYSPDYAQIDRLKTQRLKPVAIGDLSPTDPQASVNLLTVRGAPFRPAKGSFVEYLAGAMRSDLAELGIHDPRADTKISLTLLRNEFDVGIATGGARLSARVSIARAGRTVFEHDYHAEVDFDSSFAAAFAIPKAQLEYGKLVRALLGQVYSDPRFIDTLR